MALKYIQVKKLMQLDMECPYGRGCLVGGKACFNCTFHHSMTTGTDVSKNFACEGDAEKVAKHLKRMRDIEQELRRGGE